MRRIVCSLVLLALMLFLGACNGRFRVTAPGLTADGVIWQAGFLEPYLEPCGELEIDGRTYIKYCRNGVLVFLRLADAPDRVLETRSVRDLGAAVPENASVFESDGVQYAFMNLPEVLLDVSFGGTAEELIAEHEVVVTSELATGPYSLIRSR